jgi:hypothetical protein
LWEPYYLSDPGGERVGPVSEYLRDLQAAGRPGTTHSRFGAYATDDLARQPEAFNPVLKEVDFTALGLAA